MGRILYTWHDETFELTSGTIDWKRSSYWDSIPGLGKRYAAVSAKIGTREFLWCFAEATQHEYFETNKNVEWIILVDMGDILGYVETDAWEDFLRRNPSRDDWFHGSCADLKDYIVIVRFPLSHEQLISKTIYDIQSQIKPTVRERIWFR